MTRQTKVLWALGLVLALAICWPVLAHYRAKGRLEAYQRQLLAQGEKLAVKDCAPSSSPEANTAGAALLLAAGSLRLGGSVLTSPPPAMRLVAPGRALVGWQQESLPTPESTNVWPAVGAIMDVYQPTLDQIHALLRGPKLGFNLNYSQGFNLLLPHLASLKAVSQWLSAESCLALHEGRSTNAWESLQAHARLMGEFREEAVLISVLVRMAIGSIAVSATWEALQSPQLSPGQWQELQQTWEKVDILSDLERALAMERAMGGGTYAEGRQSYSCIAATGVFGAGSSTSGLSELAQLGKDVLDDPKKGLGKLAHRFPGYLWWKYWQSYDDELANARATQAALEAVRSARRQQQALGTALKEFDEAAARVQQAHPRAGGWLGYSLAADGSTHKVLERTLRFETQRQLLVAAIALKRYHLRHGNYPAKLSELTPEFVQQPPRDPIDGAPLRYRLNADGSFVLYSVGEDGLDNGGDPKPAEGNTNFRLWLQAHDVVWPVPASAGDTSAYFAELAAQRRPRSNTADEAMRRRYGLGPAAPPATNAANR